MKRCVALLLLLCTVLLTSCSGGAEPQPDVLNQPHFRGRVVEVYDTGYLLQVTDAGDGSVALESSVMVETDAGRYAVGDYLQIIFDGTVTKRYPPQILGISALYQTDAAGKRLN